MRSNPTPAIEKGRTKDGRGGTPANSGCNGMFIVNSPRYPQTSNFDGVLVIISSYLGEDGWEHVSVSCRNRTPLWEEMAWIKEQFWNDDEACFQLHPPKVRYVDNHPYCLHLWRHPDFAIPMPPDHVVGIKGLSRGQVRELNKLWTPSWETEDETGVVRRNR